MVWKIRKKDEPDIPGVSKSPSYGVSSDEYTIQMHHSSIFLELGKKKYLGGKIDYVDNCHEEEMSMLELQSSMTDELDLKGVKNFYCSCEGFEDGSDVMLLHNDVDALNMSNYVDDNRVVVVFVEHDSHVEDENGDFDIYDGIDDFEPYKELEANDVLPYISEPLNFVGDNEDVHYDETDNHVLDHNENVHNNEILHENENLHGDYAPLHENEVYDGNISGDSDDEQSVGSDSEVDEGFVDSENDFSDDDILFDENIDLDSEWAGLEMNEGPSNALVEQTTIHSHPKGNQVNKYKRHHIFNPMVDLQNTKFELGLWFGDVDTFRTTIRVHSIQNERDVNFPINENAG